MELEIGLGAFIKDVQKEFNTYYPYLRIEFFDYVHSMNNPFLKAKKMNATRLISQITEFSNAGRIDINGERTVAQFENDFWEQFGLSVQVFRKSGNLWIETTLTDSWTLDKQNKEGEFLNQEPSKSFEQGIEDGMTDPG